MPPTPTTSVSQPDPILAGKTGYMASIRDVESGWNPVAIPLTGLLNVERRHGKDEMVIEKALVKCDSPAFRYLASRREQWAHEDIFCSPGPRQLWGPAAMQIPMTVASIAATDRSSSSFDRAVPALRISKRMRGGGVFQSPGFRLVFA